MGDIIETQGYKIGRRLVKGDVGKLASETRIGRWLTGVDADDFIRYERTKKQAIFALSEAQTARQMREAADVLLHDLRDPVLVKQLQQVRANADQLIPARRLAQSLIADSERFADRVLAAEFRHRRGMTTVGTKAQKAQAYDGLIAALETSGFQRKNIPKNFMDVADYALNRRRLLSFGEGRKAIDDALDNAFEVRLASGAIEEDGVRKFLNTLDKLDRSAWNVKSVAMGMRKSGSKMTEAWKLIGRAEDGVQQPFSLRSQMRGMDGPYRKLTDKQVNAIIDTAPFMKGDKPSYVMKLSLIHI